MSEGFLESHGALVRKGGPQWVLISSPSLETSAPRETSLHFSGEASRAYRDLICLVFILFCFYTQDAKIGQAPSSNLFSWLKWLWLRCSGKESMVAWVGWEGWRPRPSALTSFFPFLGLHQSLDFWISSSSEAPPLLRYTLTSLD